MPGIELQTTPRSPSSRPTVSDTMSAIGFGPCRGPTDLLGVETGGKALGRRPGSWVAWSGVTCRGLEDGHARLRWGVEPCVDRARGLCYGSSQLAAGWTRCLC